LQQGRWQWPCRRRFACQITGQDEETLKRCTFVSYNIPDRLRLAGHYSSSRALFMAPVAAATAARLALSDASTSGPGLKLPDARDLKARSKRAPKYHATLSWEFVSCCSRCGRIYQDLPLQETPEAAKHQQHQRQRACPSCWQPRPSSWPPVLRP
jgi:hypothetical protein